MTADLFPLPQTQRTGRGETDLREARWVRIPATASARLKARARELARTWAGALNQPVETTAGKPGDARLLVRVDRHVRGIPPQGYRLRVSTHGATVQAGDEAGALYGMQTFGALLAEGNGVLRHTSIEDHPDFPARGVMLDVSRCKVPTMETLKLLIDRLASVRINQLQLYIEHTFAFADHASVWHDASPFTASQIMELDAYCAERFIELVPNFNSFGHWERWLRHPAYRQLAECPDGFTHANGKTTDHGTTLAPNRASLRLLEDLFSEYLPNFSSPLFNIGCDETWELGKGRSRKRCEADGTVRVYLEFLKKIHRLVVKHDRTMMFWGDIILHQPDLIEELPSDVIALNWGYEANHPFPRQCRQFDEAGVSFYVCPGTSGWNSLVGRTTNCLANLASAARNGLKHGASGYLNTDWGDGGHHQVLPVSYLGFTAGAAYSWCFRSNKGADIPREASRAFFGDPTGATGRLYADAGRVADLMSPKLSNRTIFSQLLFWDMDPTTLSEDCRATPRELARGVKEFDELEANMVDARPTGPDAGLVMDEFRLAIGLARHAARRGFAGEAGGPNAPALGKELQLLIAAHEAQWLKRNRPGGLRESSARLRKALGNITD